MGWQEVKTQMVFISLFGIIVFLAPVTKGDKPVYAYFCKACRPPKD